MTVKIDGRKAEITNVGKEYTTYGEFARKHGYPEAAAKSERNDPRKTPKNGDIVTLLTSGPHLSSYRGDMTLWIVEAANGERHIFNEEGLRILNEVNEAITLLPDESLGGILREYNEVKRKARVGERIKVTDGENREDGDHAVGDIRYVIFADRWENGRGASVSERAYTTTSWSSGVGIYHSRYVVLEPSDIVRINSERFRMVEQKAAVGERVVIVDADPQDEKFYGNGAIFTVERFALRSGEFHSECGRYIEADEYRVLEPLITNAIPTQTPRDQPPLSSLDPVDQYVENVATLTSNIAALTTKVQALENRMALLDSREEADAIGRTIARMIAETIAPKKTPEKETATAQQIRDEIVARAKADVERLLSTNHSNACGTLGVWFTEVGASIITDKCEFVINREKRTVVAIISKLYPMKVIGRGIAKAAPGEVFNVHIGKAIALHRALGFVVPAEYINVPGPTEVRVGDIVYSQRDVREYIVSASIVGDGRYLSLDHVLKYRSDLRVIDDSRMSVEESEGVNA